MDGGLVLLFIFLFIAILVLAILILKADQNRKERAKARTARPLETELSHALEKLTFTVTVEETRGEPEGNSAPDGDAWEGWMDWERSIPVKARVHIVYQDAKGAITERTVTTSRVNSGMILGYCHLRNANRTFHFSRIQRLVDADTGEEIQDGWAYLKRRYDQTPAGQADEALDRLDAEVAILLFMAKADGRMLAPERREIQAFIRAKATDLVIDPDAMDARVKRMDPPSLDEFRSLAQVVGKMDCADREAVLAAAVAITKTQKTVDPMEESALQILEASFGITRQTLQATA